jgi:hypothetical protein
LSEGLKLLPEIIPLLLITSSIITIQLETSINATCFSPKISARIQPVGSLWQSSKSGFGLSIFNLSALFCSDKMMFCEGEGI